MDQLATSKLKFQDQFSWTRTTNEIDYLNVTLYIYIYGTSIIHAYIVYVFYVIILTM